MTVAADSQPAEIQNNPAVLEAYLGGIDDDLDIDPSPKSVASTAHTEATA